MAVAAVQPVRQKGKRSKGVSMRSLGPAIGASADPTQQRYSPPTNIRPYRLRAKVIEDHSHNAAERTLVRGGDSGTNTVCHDLG